MTKRNSYDKWFCKIMDFIPVKVLRVLVAIILCLFGTVFVIIHALFELFVDDFIPDVVDVIKDVWSWND